MLLVWGRFLPNTLALKPKLSGLPLIKFLVSKTWISLVRIKLTRIPYLVDQIQITKLKLIPLNLEGREASTKWTKVKIRTNSTTKWEEELTPRAWEEVVAEAVFKVLFLKLQATKLCIPKVDVVGIKEWVGSMATHKIAEETIKWWTRTLSISSILLDEAIVTISIQWILSIKVFLGVYSRQRASSWKTLGTKSKMERRLKSKRSKIMWWNAPRINMAPDSFNKSMMSPLRKRRKLSSQRSCRKLILWWMMCLATMWSRNCLNMEQSSKELL